MAHLKRILYYILTLALFASCTNKNIKNKGVTSNVADNTELAANDNNAANLPEIKFEKVVHDFGIVYQGEKVSYTFKFKNIGLGELTIKDANASCGCTVPKYSREPIPSGGEGEIEVTFDTHNRTGKQMKTVKVWTNCQTEPIKLEIISEIVVPK